MLARAADNLFWMARYVERSETLARLLMSCHQTGMMPGEPGETRNGHLSEWLTPLLMTGTLDDFGARYEELTPGRVLAYMILDKNNPSSIRTSLGQARENARATRHLLTSDLWETLNQTWLAIAETGFEDLRRDGVPERLEWVRDRSHHFRGALFGSMRRGEGFHFACLGAAVERADSTARLLHVKWDTLAQRDASGRGQAHLAPDYYRAAVLLNALSAYKSYREIYASKLDFAKLADLIILREDMPRSLMAALVEIEAILLRLDPDSPPLKGVRALLQRLRSVRIDQLMRVGIHRFLDEFVAEVADIGSGIRTSFLMAS
ncbi:MAG: alpha-E domain-containing protein [Actinomycetota bacterium]